MPKPPARVMPYVWEFLALTLALVVMSLLVVRSHWITVWMDWEFTGWVAPVANRLSSGIRLYEDGLHSPMPPLPYLLVYALSGGDASWLMESTLIVVAQSLLVLIMYVALARCWARPIPLIAALGSIPIYFALPKTIFYDALVQVCVALAAAFAVPLVCTPRGPGDPGPSPAASWPRTLRLAACAVLVAVALLSKQSTGAGLALGLTLVFLLFGEKTVRGRVAETALFVLLTAAALAVLCCLLSPWVSLSGMVRDVFLTGSEPKGGLSRIASNFAAYTRTVLWSVGLVGLYGVAFAAASGTRWGPTREPASEPGRRRDGAVVPLSLAALVAPSVLVAIAQYPLRAGLFTPTLDALRPAVLTAGLISALLVSVRYLSVRGSPRRAGHGAYVAALFVVLFLSAVFHNLSAREFRWTYDNNPLITLALAVLASTALHVFFPDGIAKRTCRTWVAALGVWFVSCALWGAVSLQVRHYLVCHDRWGEIRHLRGARMIINKQNVRRFVATVRELAPNAESDAVLLLPNDPNLEAWFERPRPKLSSAVIFSDQYWDRYVDRDFQALCASPPQVVVVGPRNYWRQFQRKWNVQKGCERLIDLVQDKLLPERYVLHASQEIQHRGVDDFMDIYIFKPARVDDIARPVSSVAPRR